MGTKSRDSTSSSGVFAPVTPAASNLPGGVTRGLLVGTGGTATLMDAEGNTRANVPLQAGYNPLQVRQVISLGTASDIWALY